MDISTTLLPSSVDATASRRKRTRTTILIKSSDSQNYNNINIIINNNMTKNLMILNDKQNVHNSNNNNNTNINNAVQLIIATASKCQNDRVALRALATDSDNKLFMPSKELQQPKNQQQPQQQCPISMSENTPKKKSEKDINGGGAVLKQNDQQQEKESNNTDLITIKNNNNQHIRYHQSTMPTTTAAKVITAPICLLSGSTESTSGSSSSSLSLSLSSTSSNSSTDDSDGFQHKTKNDLTSTSMIWQSATIKPPSPTIVYAGQNGLKNGKSKRLLSKFLSVVPTKNDNETNKTANTSTSSSSSSQSTSSSLSSTTTATTCKSVIKQNHVMKENAFLTAIDNLSKNVASLSSLAKCAAKNVAKTNNHNINNNQNNKNNKNNNKINRNTLNNHHNNNNHQNNNNVVSIKHSNRIPSDILDDLASRFVINVPDIEVANLIRVCFQIELAHWFYLDFFCTTISKHHHNQEQQRERKKQQLQQNEQNSSNEQQLQHQQQQEEEEQQRIIELTAETSKIKLQPCGIKYFALQLFEHIPFLRQHSASVDKILEEWKNYKLSVPTFGAILVSEDLNYCLLVQSYFAKSSWGFPKGKVNENEDPVHCATREVYEETGYDISNIIDPNDYIEAVINYQYTRLYIVRNVSLETHFEPRTRYEIRSCDWFLIDSLPVKKSDAISKSKLGIKTNSFFMIMPFVKRLKSWVNDSRTTRNITTLTATTSNNKTIATTIATGGTSYDNINNIRSAIVSTPSCDLANLLATPKSTTVTIKSTPIVASSSSLSSINNITTTTTTSANEITTNQTTTINTQEVESTNLIENNSNNNNNINNNNNNSIISSTERSTTPLGTNSPMAFFLNYNKNNKNNNNNINATSGNKMYKQNINHKINNDNNPNNHKNKENVSAFNRAVHELNGDLNSINHTYNKNNNNKTTTKSAFTQINTMATTTSSSSLPSSSSSSSSKTTKNTNEPALNGRQRYKSLGDLNHQDNKPIKMTSSSKKLTPGSVKLLTRQGICYNENNTLKCEYNVNQESPITSKTTTTTVPTVQMGSSFNAKRQLFLRHSVNYAYDGDYADDNKNNKEKIFVEVSSIEKLMPSKVNENYMKFLTPQKSASHVGNAADNFIQSYGDKHSFYKYDKKSHEWHASSNKKTPPHTTSGGNNKSTYYSDNKVYNNRKQQPNSSFVNNGQNYKNKSYSARATPVNYQCLTVASTAATADNISPIAKINKPPVCGNNLMALASAVSSSDIPSQMMASKTTGAIPKITTKQQSQSQEPKDEGAPQLVSSSSSSVVSSVITTPDTTSPVMFVHQELEMKFKDRKHVLTTAAELEAHVLKVARERSMKNDENVTKEQQQPGDKKKIERKKQQLQKKHLRANMLLIKKSLNSDDDEYYKDYIHEDDDDDDVASTDESDEQELGEKETTKVVDEKASALRSPSLTSLSALASVTTTSPTTLKLAITNDITKTAGSTHPWLNFKFDTSFMKDIFN